MKNSDEMLQSLFERRDRYFAEQRRKRRNTVKTLAVVIPLCGIIVLSVGALRSGLFKRQAPVIPDEIPETTGTVYEPADDTSTIPDQSTDAVDTEDTSETAVPVSDTSASSKNEGHKNKISTSVTERTYTTGPAETDPAETERVYTAGPDDSSSTTGPDDSRTDVTTEIPDDTATTEPDETKPQEPDGDRLFADVDVSDWSYKSIEYAVERGYMTGRTEELFEPEENLTRAEFVYALYTMDGSPEVNEYYNDHKCCFDVENDAWYHDAVVWAMDNLCFTGKIGDGTNAYFGPDLEIIRADVAVILMQYVEYRGDELDLFGKGMKFNDFDDIDIAPDYSREAIKALAGAGVISGKNGTSFDPLAGTTRAEAAVMLKTLIDNSHEVKASRLLEQFGLTDMHVSVISDSSGQHVRITFKSTEEYDWKQLFWPDAYSYDYPGPEFPMSVEVDVSGSGCDISGLDLELKYSRFAWGDSKYADPRFEYDIPHLKPVYDEEGNIIYYDYGYGPGEAADFHTKEIVKVTVRIRIGSFTETIVKYPSVSN